MSENVSENTAMNTDVILEKEVGLSIPKAVRIASNQLREEILRADKPGEFLGSEEDLINRLSISRPTFRQVARLLELEQLLTIKRGPGGGFFSRRPSFQGIVHQATVCLVAHKATVANLMSVGRQLICEAAVQAANNPSDRERRRLLDYIATIPADKNNEDTSFWMKVMRDFTFELLTVSANPALMMFTHITQSFAGYQFDVKNWVNTDHIQHYRALQERLARAVADGDPEYSKILADRINDLMHSWNPHVTGAKSTSA